MALYDYICDACGHEFEEFQSITDPVLKKCPQCGKEKLRRLIGPGSALIFRGSGFYCTDYRKGTPPGGRGAAASSESSDSGGDSSGDGKKDN